MSSKSHKKIRVEDMDLSRRGKYDIFESTKTNMILFLLFRA